MTQNNDSQDTSGRIDRRKFLKAAGATAAMGAAGVVPVEAKPGTSLGPTHFVEAAFEVELPALDDPRASYPVMHFETPLDRTVSPDGEQLFLTKPAPESAIETIKQNEGVVRAQQFHPLSDGLGGGKVNKIPTNLLEHYRRGYFFEPEDAIEVPSVEFERNGNVISPSGKNVSGTINPGSEGTFELGSQDVSVELRKSTDDLVENPDVPEKYRATKTERWTETVRITPKLRIRNYGQVTAIDATDKLVVEQAQRSD
ncbi:twin-arginine translocation signal domain-containing protein [Halorussus salilacus]|uniref:twin-arginine translocation signal domain-containing protein n=1 Tax=Halorussus salilacus TaxID=2953750 RepID=UPI00209DDCDF|nr:twin-arginine translocation signal domain-containing protein [Halorussus salilacus]USZ68630.1 twin-arginine translocation signal domain-containing protein [Halorussus salilacus]